MALGKQYKIMNNVGFTLAEVVIAFGVGSIGLIAVASLVLELMNVERKSELDLALTIRRIEFERAMKSPSGYQAILTRNPAMACLSSQDGCASQSGKNPMILPLGDEVLDGNSSSLGLTSKGDFCNTFNETSGDTTCLVGLEINWEAQCESASCLQPQAKMQVAFKRRGAGEPLVRLPTFDLAVYSEASLTALSDICVAMSGVMVGQSCQLPQLNSQCDVANGSYVLGFDSSGSAICGKPTVGSCTDGYVLTGFDPHGEKICSPGCAL